LLGLFKKPYPVRVYEAQVIVNGYASSPYHDVTMSLDVQPFTPDELMALPEGERTIKRVKSFGSAKLASANEYEGIPGVRLFYSGQWYECVSSVKWDHTILSHYRSDFTILPESAQMLPP